MDEQLDDQRPKAWSQPKAMAIGLVIGVLLWLLGERTLDSARGILFPPVVGILIVWWHNKRHQVGEYDPETIERNKRGTL